MTNRFKQKFAITLAGLLMLAAFQNCASESSGGTAAAAASPTAATTTTVTLTLTANSTSLSAYQSLLIKASGGTAPYKFSVIGGSSGTVDATSGWFTANSTVGTSVIQATDANGAVGQITMTVTASSSTSTTTTTTASCDDVIPASFSQSCAGTTNSSCSVTISYASQIPHGCKVSEVVVNAQHFSGNIGSCSAYASLPFTTSGTQGTGYQSSTKTAYLSVQTDMASRSITLTSQSYGWESTDSGPHNSCISNISLEIHLSY